jgi:ethylene-insensitive protein 2
MVMFDYFQISGIAMGFNLVFEYDDIVTGIWFASFAVNLLPYTISHLVPL